MHAAVRSTPCHDLFVLARSCAYRKKTTMCSHFVHILSLPVTAMYHEEKEIVRNVLHRVTWLNSAPLASMPIVLDTSSDRISVTSKKVNHV